MRAIGFSEYTDRKKLKELLTDVIMNSDHRAYTMNQEGILLGEFSKNHTATRGAIESGTFGVAVCGEFDDNDKFIYEYYYPYLTEAALLLMKMSLWNVMRRRIPMPVSATISRWESL